MKLCHFEQVDSALNQFNIDMESGQIKPRTWKALGGACVRAGFRQNVDGCFVAWAERFVLTQLLSAGMEVE